MHRRRRSCRVVFLGGPKVYACKNWSSPRGGEIINPPGGEIILRKVHPADNEGGFIVGNYFTLKRVFSFVNENTINPLNILFEIISGGDQGGGA